ncbi:MAG: hypothetical protein BWY31_03394 [Lentisphaerae bacterium ADurb.Bin242]|nr:MAG: hypothetical protein BWY31_03394 [Lentisphaerae bacterium ADurb.Bin242]
MKKLRRIEGISTLLKTMPGKKGKEAVTRLCVPASGKKHGTPFRSGAAPYRIESDGTILVMLVTPVGGGKWILPKGNIKRGMSGRESAEEEAREEAGVIGKCDNFLLGVSRFKNGQFIEIYPMKIAKILGTWEESGRRSRFLFPLEEARRELDDRDAAAILERLRQYIAEKE